MDPSVKTFYELVYGPAEVKDLILKKWPATKITDASDSIHPERFEVEVEATKEEFYVFAIQEGFAECCLGFQMRMRTKEHHFEVWKWIELARK